MKISKICAKILVAALCVGSCHVAVPTPAAASMIGTQEEIAMGKASAQALEAQYGLCQDYELQERVERVGKRLAAVAKRKDVTYSFKVLNCSEINALACPGGFVYVYKGLLDYMPSDTELAGVLSHEITHVEERHTVHSIEKQMLGNVLLIGAAIAAGGNAIGALGTVQAALYSGFSRTDERGADKGGFNLCLAADYNPYSVLITMEKLDDYSKAKGYTDNYGVFSSHPEPEERAKVLQGMLDKLHIQPIVTLTDDNHALVSEGTWSFPINQSIGGTKARYRAYMLAGSLWTIRRKGMLNLNHFVVYDNGKTADLYYEDTQLYTLYPQDVPAGYTLSTYAAACAEQLKEWAQMVNSNVEK